MAVSPYQEGKVWSFRLRIKGQAIYRTGFPTSKAARDEADRLRQAILDAGKPKHEGPWKTTLGQALQRYALERLPGMKGARQESNRINRYLRAAGLDIVRIREPSAADITATGTHWIVWIERAPAERCIPSSLVAHRMGQRARATETEKQIQFLVKSRVAEIMTYQVQELVNVMQFNGYEAASIGLERALLRAFFNYARSNWHWAEPARNPAVGLTMPAIDNARSRVLTNKEWNKLSAELRKAPNPYVAPALALLLETAMRVSEPLLHATWANVDYEACVLHLNDGKTGARDVPLNPAAMNILRMLTSFRLNDDDSARILPITYETIKATWNRACMAAGVEDVHIHDLRHTAATRFTLELNGNLPVLKIITGHKTFSQLSRYINVKPEDVSRLLHKRPLTEPNAPAGLHLTRAELVPPSPEPQWLADELPGNVVPLRRMKEAGGAP